MHVFRGLSDGISSCGDLKGFFLVPVGPRQHRFGLILQGVVTALQVMNAPFSY